MSTVAALMVRKLCHDFAGPAGAIVTTIEMLGDGPDPELTALAAESSAALVAALELYRYALTPETEAAGCGRGRRLLAAWLAARGGPGLDWQEEDRVWPAGVGPLTVGLAMIAADVAPRGAILHVSEGVVLAPSTAIAAEAAAALGGAGATTTRAALAAALQGEASAAGMNFTVEDGDPLRLAVGYQSSRLPR